MKAIQLRGSQMLFIVIETKTLRGVGVYFKRNVVLIFEYVRNTIAYQPTIIHRHCEARSNLVYPKSVLRWDCFVPRNDGV